MQDPSGELTVTGVVQREAWLQRAMPPAEQPGQDLWSLPVPIPDNPLRYVSVYAFGTGEGLVLIDAGWGAEESWRALRDGLESIGAGVADVRGTHMHFDHVGLAGRVRQASGAWIAMHPADRAVFARSDYRSAERAVAVEAEFLRSGQMRIFAVTETAAHAHLLERRGLVTASRTRPPVYTARAA
jgi:glyoxylase-like metal-dependent hydrolase (beta-lactamase superfamily II)